MPREIPLTEKTEWLKARQEGQSQAAIARRFGRDVRTIKRGIEEVRRAQDSQAARMELLKDALQNHQKALLGIIDDVLSALVPLPTNLELPLQRHYTPVTIPLSGATVSYDSEKGWIVTLEDEGTALWGLVREHLRRDRMWNALNRWEKAIAAHLEARMALKLKTAALLEKKTGLKMDPAQPTYVEPSVVELFYEVALNRALGIPDTRSPEKNIMASGDGYVLYFNSRIANTEAGAEDKCVKDMLDALKKLQMSPEVGDAVATYRELEESTAKARRAVEEISLLGLVPGQCRVCRRLGI